MAYTIKHNFQSGKADGTDVTLVKPTNWNANHDLIMDEGTVIGRPPGSGTGPGQDIPITSLMPTGMIMPFAGSYEPPGWMNCDGRSLLRADYGALFSVIGASYGAADAAHFSLPDLRGRVVSCVDNGAGVMPGWGLGTKAGATTHTLSAHEMPYHGHSFSDSGHGHGVGDPGHAHTPAEGANWWAAGGPYYVTSFGGGSWNMYHSGATTPNATGIWIGTGYAAGTVGANGGNGAHNNIQPTIALNYLIKT